MDLQQKRKERQDWLASLEFFDAHCQLFNHLNASLDNVTASTKRLLAEMDRCGVAKALVYHGNATEVGIPFTNDEIAKAVKPYPDRFTGVWTILPEQCREIPPADKLFVKMAQNNIGALTLFPVAHRWQANRLTIGKTMDAAAERKVPVILKLDALDNAWKGLFDFMKEFPETTAIVAGVRLWGSDRNIRPLLENYPNLCVELGEYWVPEGIADLAKLYGADRLLYGSDLPSFGFGSTMLSIVNSTLPYADITKIASGNIKRLLNWI